MKAYSLDLRQKIVESVKKVVPKSETAADSGSSSDGQALLQTTRRTRHSRIQEGSRQETEAGPVGEEAARERP
jgi:hypothetical protein